MTIAFEAWVAALAAGEDFANVHQDDPEDQAEFWIGSFINEVAGRENTCHDYDNDDIELGLLFGEVSAEFFDD